MVVEISKKERTIPSASELTKIKKIHMTAICGSGMATLAGLLVEKGYHVSGSDQEVYPPMSTQLSNMGIKLKKGFDPSRVKDVDLVVMGNVISRGNPELEETFEKGIPCLSLPESLHQFFLINSKPIVVTGTHGKTTTSSILAYLLDVCGEDPGFFVGGILQNYACSYRLGKKGGPFVVEGDEYDSACFDKRPKFVHYPPHIAILTGIEFDHADIYSSLDEIKNEFKRFLMAMPEGRVLIACAEAPHVKEMVGFSRAKVILYGLEEKQNWHAQNISENKEGVSFDLIREGKNLGRFHSPLLGKHNLNNLLASLAALTQFEISPEKALEKLKGFKGILRRQQIRGEIMGITVIDDFAHHPTEVKVTLESLRNSYPQGSLWVIFEPRTATSRRKFFQNTYVESFSPADFIAIAPVFKPEKAPTGDRFSCEKLIDDLKKRGQKAIYFSDVHSIVDYVSERVQPHDVIAILSNGSFEEIHEKILKKLNEKL